MRKYLEFVENSFLNYNHVYFILRVIKFLFSKKYILVVLAQQEQRKMVVLEYENMNLDRTNRGKGNSHFRTLKFVFIMYKNQQQKNRYSKLKWIFQTKFSQQHLNKFEQFSCYFWRPHIHAWLFALFDFLLNAPIYSFTL